MNGLRPDGHRLVQAVRKQGADLAQASRNAADDPALQERTAALTPVQPDKPDSGLIGGGGVGLAVTNEQQWAQITQMVRFLSGRRIRHDNDHLIQRRVQTEPGKLPGEPVRMLSRRQQDQPEALPAQ